MPIFGSMLMLWLHELSEIITVLFSNYECESIVHTTFIVFKRFNYKLYEFHSTFVLTVLSMYLRYIMIEARTEEHGYSRGL